MDKNSNKEKQSGITSSNRKYSVFSIVRFLILFFILAGVMIINYLHLHGGTQYPSVHAVCPLGGLENLWAWVGGRANLQKLFSGTMTLFFLTIIFSLVFGRAFCGNICPFGFLQELVGKISKKKIIIPKNIDKILRLGKYFILALVTFMAWITATIWISPYDPWTAFAHIWSGEELFTENLIGFIILLSVMLLSVFIDRFFCRYLCPAGALYGLASKISPFKVKKESCKACSKCSTSCPMGIDLTETESLPSAECIACGECITQCPSKKTKFHMTMFGKVIKPISFLIITVTVFFASILILNQFGLMKVTIPTIESVQQTENYLQIADLRGSMTIEAGAEYTGMELSEFYKVMEIPETVPKDTPLKYVEQYVPGYDFHVIKANK